MEKTLVDNNSLEREVSTKPTRNKTLSLALQGGGSHGAFTWGVLDRLLEDPRISLDGISGASAGALNAVVLADGMVRGGRDGARAALKAFWDGVSTGEPLNGPGSQFGAVKAFLFWSRFY